MHGAKKLPAHMRNGDWLREAYGVGALGAAIVLRGFLTVATV
jgi:hypothetical protein